MKSSTTTADSHTEDMYLTDLSKITQGAGISLSGNMLGKILMFFYIIFIARFLGTDSLGIYYLGITIARFATILSVLGLDSGVVRYVAIYNGQNDLCRMKGTVLISAAITAITSLVIACLIYLTGDIVATFIFRKPELGVILRLLALSIPFVSLMRVFLASTQGLKLMQYVIYTENVFWISLRFLLTIFFLLVLGWGLEGVVLAYVVSSIFAAVLALYYSNKFIPLLERKTSPILERKKLLHFSIPMAFTSMLHDLISYVDILLLGIFVSASKIGIYSVAVKTISLARITFMVFQPIFQPFVADLYAKKDFERLSKLLKVVTQWSVTISFPVFLSLFLFPSFFLLMFGKEFTLGSVCLSVLAMTYGLNSISNLPSAMIFMSGRSDISLKNNIFVLTINVFLNYLLIPQYGILGAAVATGISLFLLSFLRLYQAYFLMKIHPFKNTLWKPFISGLISFFPPFVVLKFIGIDQFYTTAFLLVLSTALYTLLLYSFHFSDEDIFIIQIIKKKLRKIFGWESKDVYITRTKLILETIVSIILYYSGFYYLYLKLNISGREIPIIFYHEIGEVKNGSLHGFSVSPDKFEKQMKWLSKHYTVISVDDLVRTIQGEIRFPGRIAAVTFDGGYVGNYKYAFPILNKYEIPATIFIITHFINGNISWERKLLYLIFLTKETQFKLNCSGEERIFDIRTIRQKHLVKRSLQEYSTKLDIEEKNNLLIQLSEKLDVKLSCLAQNIFLSWSQIIEMNKNPLIEIGSHSSTHPRLTDVSYEEATRDIFESRAHIEAALGKRVSSFCYPDGYCSDNIQNLIKKAGYSSGLSVSTPGILSNLNKVGDNVFELRRICISNQSFVSFFALELSGLMQILKNITKSVLTLNRKSNS